MQYMTNSYLPSTPHKVGLNTRERYAFAYFHEPSFQAVARPLPGYEAGQEPQEGIHYGTHFTNMFMKRIGCTPLEFRAGNSKIPSYD